MSIARRHFIGGCLAATFVRRPVSAKLPTSLRPIGLQLHSLGEALRRDLEGTFARVSRVGYQEVELAGLQGHSAAKLRAAADRSGLRITSVHVEPAPLLMEGKFVLGDGSVPLVEALHQLGAGYVVAPMPLLPSLPQPTAGESMQSAIARGIHEGGADLWKRTAEALNSQGAALRREGITLGYHNHNFDFFPMNRTTGLDILLSESAPETFGLELDVGWAATAGIQPITLLRTYAARIHQMHLKDIDPATPHNFALEQKPALLGRGVIAWPALMAEAERLGVQHYYVEREVTGSGDGFIDLAADLAFLHSVLPGAAR